MGIELVVTDLDGTLWNSSQTIDQQTLNAIAHLQSSDIEIVAATARGPKSTFRILNQFGLSMPAVLCNGAVGRLPDGNSFHKAQFSNTAVSEILALFAEAALVPTLPIDHPQYGAIVPANASACARFLDETRADVLVADAQEALSHDVVAFRVLGVDREVLDEVASRCIARDDTRVYFGEDALYGKWSLQVGPIAANKWTGVAAYCKFAGINETKVLGIGDDLNDIDYLQRVHTSIAMPHSPLAVKEVADHVLAKDQTWSAILDYL